MGIMPNLMPHWTLSAHSALPVERRGGVKVTDRYGESVGRIQGLGRGGKREQPRDHLLDLLLFGAAVPYHGGLNGQRRIFRNFQSGRSRSQHRNSAHLPEFQR